MVNALFHKDECLQWLGTGLLLDSDIEKQVRVKVLSNQESKIMKTVLRNAPLITECYQRIHIIYTII